MVYCWVIILIHTHIQHAMYKSIIKHVSLFIFWLVQILLVLFLIHQILLPTVPVLLLSFNIFEHILVFRQIYIVWKYFWKLIIKLNDSWHPFNSFSKIVESFQKFTHIVKNQIVFELRYNIRTLIINDVIYNFDIIVSSARQIFLLQILLQHLIRFKIYRVLFVQFTKRLISNFKT